VTVLVIGGGFAGVAAAWALGRRGREVLLAWQGPGASALYSGALDRQQWDGPADPRPVSRDVEEFLQTLDCWAPPGTLPVRLATSGGLLRPARCRDRALLDLEPLRGRRIDVVDIARPGWDAVELARAWSVSHWARQTRTQFRALGVVLPEGESLSSLPEGELAARADDPVWANALGDVLAAAGDGEAPLLCGPWLGLLPGSVERVRARARRPLGETLSAPGGPAGFRFEAARDAWLARSGVRVQRGLAERVLPTPGGFQVEPFSGLFSEVVLALGGVVGGGIRFLAGPVPAGRTFALSLAAPLTLRLGGREVTLESGVLGADLQSLGRSSIEQVGLLVDDDQLTQSPGLFAAGELVADRPRTALEAIYAGISAARGACRGRASINP